MAEMLAVCFLLWRVETLSDLSALQQSTTATDGDTTSTSPAENEESLPPGAHDKITPLLQERCIDAQLYLQHDLTLQQLAKAIGINRYYLSQYFSRQGTTYNAYINGLRIDYFVRLYNEAASAHRPFTTKQLAYDSGYRSYSTFSLAFKQRTGQNVTSWMRNHN
jgi:AraC-like DNA-binding protein